MECPVCLHTFKIHCNVTKMKCTHSLCNDCYKSLTDPLGNSFECSNKCPMCRSVIMEPWELLLMKIKIILFYNLLILILLIIYEDYVWLNKALIAFTIFWDVLVLV